MKVKFPIRGLEGLYQEHQFVVPRQNIEGNIPEALYGAFYKNGPGKNEVAGQKNNHWFDGDGMISAFYFKNGQVTFKNAFVKTHWYLKEQQQGKRLFQTFGNLIDGGIRANFLAFLHKHKNPANTNVEFHNDKLLALYEAGRPYALDPLTLETLGEECFGGQLKKEAAFCAHPKKDPNTGMLYAIGSEHKMKYNKLAIFQIDAQGKMTTLLSLPMDKRRMMVHDFLLVENHLIVTYMPFYPKPILPILIGTKSLSETITYDSSGKNTVFLIDLKSKSYKSFDMPPQYIYHCINGHKEGSDFTFYNFPFKDASNLEAVREFMNKGSIHATPPTFQKITIKNAETISLEEIHHKPAEMPTINPCCQGKKHRFFYACYMNDETNILSNKIMKSEYNGRFTLFDFEPDQIVGEPIFVPKPGGTEEDDGWVMTTVYDRTTHRSFLSIIDGQCFSKEVARIHLPFHLPLSFHGGFVDGREIAGFENHDQSLARSKMLA